MKMMMYMMPVVFTFFSFSFPSGLVLYWLVSNVFQIGQQYLMQSDKKFLSQFMDRLGLKSNDTAETKKPSRVEKVVKKAQKPEGKKVATANSINEIITNGARRERKKVRKKQVKGGRR